MSQPACEPAPVLECIDCGSGQDFGVCRKCDRGHGYLVYRNAAGDSPEADPESDDLPIGPRRLSDGDGVPLPLITDH